MFRVRRANERGGGDHGWLKSRHTFSFSNYQDREHMRFRALRVMNEDWIKPGQGFGTHPHNDMEIVTYVLEGALEHRDSMGNGEVLRPGEFQRMTAGTGITHSEFNPSKTEPTHLYQIWLYPERENLEPSYEQKRFADDELQNQLRLVASPDARDGSLLIHQDAQIYVGRLAGGTEVTHHLPAGRHAWLQVLRGNVDLQSEKLSAGDGVAISEEQSIDLIATGDAEVMLFDLA